MVNVDAWYSGRSLFTTLLLLTWTICSSLSQAAIQITAKGYHVWPLLKSLQQQLQAIPTVLSLDSQLFNTWDLRTCHLSLPWIILWFLAWANSSHALTTFCPNILRPIRKAQSQWDHLHELVSYAYNILCNINIFASQLELSLTTYPKSYSPLSIPPTALWPSICTGNHIYTPVGNLCV